MDATDVGGAVEVGDGAGDLQRTVEAAGREAHAIRRVAQESRAARRPAGLPPR